MLVAVKIRVVILKLDSITGDCYVSRVGGTDPNQPTELQKLKIPVEQVNLLAIGDQFDVTIPDIDMTPA